MFIFIRGFLTILNCCCLCEATISLKHKILSSHRLVLNIFLARLQVRLFPWIINLPGLLQIHYARFSGVTADVKFFQNFTLSFSSLLLISPEHILVHSECLTSRTETIWFSPALYFITYHHIKLPHTNTNSTLIGLHLVLFNCLLTHWLSCCFPKTRPNILTNTVAMGVLWEASDALGLGVT